MDSHVTITEEEIPSLVDTLKSVMGVKIEPPRSHCLHQHFVDYESAASVLMNLRGCSTRVFELANYGSYLESFRRDWADNIVLMHLRNRLMDSHQSTVMGALFEFRTAFHFKFMHGDVSWLPNLSNQSEFDLQVVTHSNSKVLIECTRKQPKPARTEDPELLVNDVDASVRSKLDKEAFNRTRAWVCVLLPEYVNWNEWNHCDQLQVRMKNIFATGRGRNLLGVCVVSHREPRVRIVGRDLRVYEDDNPVWSLGNKRMNDCIPMDFYPGLPPNL